MSETSKPTYRHQIASAMLVAGWTLLGVGSVTGAWEFSVAAICAFVCSVMDYWITR